MNLPEPIKKTIDPQVNNTIGLFRRYWRLVVGFLVLLALVLFPHTFHIFGSLLFLPLLAFGTTLTALGVRFAFFRRTLDDDVHSGLFEETWKSLDPKIRLYLILAFTAVLILSFSWIASGLVR